jgi:hypothetical protein
LGWEYPEIVPFNGVLLATSRAGLSFALHSGYGFCTGSDPQIDAIVAVATSDRKKVYICELMKARLIVPLIFATALSSPGEPSGGTNRTTPETKLLLGQPLSSWTASYGSPRSDNGKDAVFQTREGTAYVILGNSGLTECASLVANIADLNRLADIVTGVCQSLGVGYKDEAIGPKGKFHRYESKDGAIRAAITATPPELVIIVQTKAFSAKDNSPMTAALWK